MLDGANYIGVGPTFPSPTKQFELSQALALVRQVAAEIRLPAFAIGGITSRQRRRRAGGRRFAHRRQLGSRRRRTSRQGGATLCWQCLARYSVEVQPRAGGMMAGLADANRRRTATH